MPGFATTLSVVLLPLVVMVGKTFIAAHLAQGSALREWVSFIGNPLVAIALSVLWAYRQLGLRRGKSRPSCWPWPSAASRHWRASC
jgi:GntP family gluconate:H+ symporter/D-serine transporter